MWSVATDVTRGLCVCVCFCIGHTDVLGETAEPIEMPFGGLTLVD